MQLRRRSPAATRQSRRNRSRPVLRPFPVEYGSDCTGSHRPNARASAESPQPVALLADAGLPRHSEPCKAMDDAWRLWGPYLAERAWGTVREDYSADGDAWTYLSHDHSRSYAYRWSEDGL